MFKRIIRNTFYLSFSQIITKLFYLLLIILITRHLGKSGLGNYIFILTLGDIIFRIGDFGLNQLIVKILSRNKKLKKSLFSNLVILRLFLSLISICLLVGLTKFLIYAQLIEKALALPIYLFGFVNLINMQIFNLSSYFEAFQKMEYEALVNLVRSLLQVSFSIVFLVNGKGLLHLALAFNIGGFIAFLIGTVILLKMITSISMNINIRLCFQLIKESLSFFISKSLGFIIFETDIVMLKIISGAVVTGLYGAAYALIKNIIFIVSTFSTSVYPQMSIFFKESKNKAVDFYKKSKTFLLSWVIIIFLFISLFAKQIVLLLYGSGFSNTILPLRLLSLVGFLMILIQLNNTYLFSINKQKTVVWVKSFVCVLNILLNFILILKYGLMGAISATIISSMVYLGLTSYMIFSYNKQINYLT